jgi:thiosulfate reductase cytochrome b subunit
MTQLWGRRWVRWLAGFLFGAVLGYSLFVIGIYSLLIAGFTLLVAVLRRWHLAFVSGWFSGIGAVLLWVMGRVLGFCGGDPTCVSDAATWTFIAVSLGFLLVGLVTGIAAWRRGQQPTQAPV